MGRVLLTRSAGFLLLRERVSRVSIRQAANLTRECTLYQTKASNTKPRPYTPPQAHRYCLKEIGLTLLTLKNHGQLADFCPSLPSYGTVQLTDHGFYHSKSHSYFDHYSLWRESDCPTNFNPRSPIMRHQLLFAAIFYYKYYSEAAAAASTPRMVPQGYLDAGAE